MFLPKARKVAGPRGDHPENILTEGKKNGCSPGGTVPKVCSLKARKMARPQGVGWGLSQKMAAIWGGLVQKIFCLGQEEWLYPPGGCPEKFRRRGQEKWLDQGGGGGLSQEVARHRQEKMAATWGGCPEKDPPPGKKNGYTRGGGRLSQKRFPPRARKNGRTPGEAVPKIF